MVIDATVLDKGRVRKTPFFDEDLHLLFTRADLLAHKTLGYTFEEYLEKAHTAKKPENMRSLVAWLRNGTFEKLFAKEPEKCKALKKLIAAKLLEVTWENILEAIKQVEGAGPELVEEIQEKYSEHHTLHKGNEGWQSLYTKDQIETLFQAIDARVKALEIQETS